MNEKNVRVDVVMPTWQNAEMASISKQSLINSTSRNLRFYKFTDTKTNKGWMEGCNEGIKESLDKYGSEFVVLANDDIVMSPTSDWVEMMTKIMDDNKEIAVVGPTTNAACGWSNLYNMDVRQFQCDYFAVPYMSFFFVMIRKEAIKQVGLLDSTLPGGDDLDYSFRLNDAGFKTVITPKVFCWHKYGQTGKKLFGEYWDSVEHTKKIHNELIRKHGLKRYIYGITGYDDSQGGWS